MALPCFSGTWRRKHLRHKKHRNSHSLQSGSARKAKERWSYTIKWCCLHSTWQNRFRIRFSALLARNNFLITSFHHCGQLPRRRDLFPANCPCISANPYWTCRWWCRMHRYCSNLFLDHDSGLPAFYSHSITSFNIFWFDISGNSDWQQRKGKLAICVQRIRQPASCVTKSDSTIARSTKTTKNWWQR